MHPRRQAREIAPPCRTRRRRKSATAQPVTPCPPALPGTARFYSTFSSHSPDHLVLHESVIPASRAASGARGKPGVDRVSARPAHIASINQRLSQTKRGKRVADRVFDRTGARQTGPAARLRNGGRAYACRPPSETQRMDPYHARSGRPRSATPQCVSLPAAIKPPPSAETPAPPARPTPRPRTSTDCSATTARSTPRPNRANT